MTKVFIVPGTWEFDGEDAHDEYWEPDSSFAKFLNQNDCELASVDGDPFIWSTALTGVSPLSWFGKHDKHTAWVAAGMNFKHYMKDVPLKDRNVITHSHGGQVMAYACANGLELRSVLTLMMPVRKDMNDAYRVAANNIGWWTHVHSDWSDLIQIWGSLFDGRLGIHRECEYADCNTTIPKVGHSTILRDPSRFHIWNDYQLFANFK